MDTGRTCSAIGLVAALALGVPSPAAAQSVQRSLHVTALDASGAPVPNLAPADFIVREDKVAREVLRVAPATDPLQIALLVDDSPASGRYLVDYREALKGFISTVASDPAVDGKHTIALVTVAGRPTIRENYTPDINRVLKSADGLFPQTDSLSCMVDAVYEVSEGIVRRHSPRPVIVALTVGGNEDASNRSYVETLEMLRQSGAALYVVAVGIDPSRSNDLTQVVDMGTRDSGGEYQNVIASTGLKRTMVALATALTHQYLVTYAHPDSLIPPDKVTVSSSRPNVSVHGTLVRDAIEEKH